MESGTADLVGKTSHPGILLSSMTQLVPKAIMEASQGIPPMSMLPIYYSYSELLYARPSFLEGMGRVFDLGGTMTDFNRSLTPEQADALAIWSDWRAVGADLISAFAALQAIAESERIRGQAKEENASRPVTW